MYRGVSGEWGIGGGGWAGGGGYFVKSSYKLLDAGSYRCDDNIMIAFSTRHVSVRVFLRGNVSQTMSVDMSIVWGLNRPLHSHVFKDLLEINYKIVHEAWKVYKCLVVLI